WVAWANMANIIASISYLRSDPSCSRLSVLSVLLWMYRVCCIQATPNGPAVGRFRMVVRQRKSPVSSLGMEQLNRDKVLRRASTDEARTDATYSRGGVR